VFSIKAEGTLNLLDSLFLAYTPLKTFLVLGCVFSTWSISKVFILSTVVKQDLSASINSGGGCGVYPSLSGGGGVYLSLSGGGAYISLSAAAAAYISLSAAAYIPLSAAAAAVVAYIPLSATAAAHIPLSTAAAAYIPLSAAAFSVVCPLKFFSEDVTGIGL
jgi:hypothetical protein